MRVPCLAEAGVAELAREFVDIVDEHVDEEDFVRAGWDLKDSVKALGLGSKVLVSVCIFNKTVRDEFKRRGWGDPAEYDSCWLECDGYYEY